MKTLFPHLSAVIVLFAVATLWSVSANAQDNHHQLGLNATQFASQFLNFGDSDPIDGGDYHFTYKYVFGKTAIRAGIGGTFQSNESNDNVIGDQTVSSLELDVRAGFEWQNELTTRWLIYYGIDGLYTINNSEVVFDSGFDKVTSSTETQGFGAGPVVGIQFNINDFLSLQTESAFYTLSTTTTESDKFSSNPEFNQEDKSSGLSATVVLPTALLFVIRF